MADFETRFGFLIADIARLYGTQFDRRARGNIELSRAQCRVAVYLSTFGQMNQAKLAELLEVTPMTVARILDRMQEGGWIVRVQDPNDRRAFHVQATAKTDEVLVDAQRLGDEVVDTALAGLTPEERKVLIGLLQRVRRNLSAADG
ncbi:MarR family transcriptional regulator [Pigmentiphaga soli]|uniref:MarR family transcriptional regulator n=1 Tax=Pigmentiphaga soli TaxID=1007095 RepID=A0ABP8GL96_9BURK